MCETTTNNNEIKERTPIKKMSIDEKKAYFKKIAQKHYSNPANKAKQAKRMKLMMADPIVKQAYNNKVSRNRRLKTIAKRLGVIWANKGLIKFDSIIAISVKEIKETCICGSILNKCGMSKHKKTQKHRMYVQLS
jgi:hypothetical protein